MQQKKIPLKVLVKRQEALYNKYMEYSLLTLEELEKLKPTLGGSYKQACKMAINNKQIENSLEGEVK